MSLKKFDQDELVFKQGSVADKFYVILKGSVYIMIANKDPSKNMEPSPSFREKYVH
jgi:hypothetical protein